ncbi:hypothetical protein LguiA_018033 [Lonicera macranthoides]
MFWVMPKLWRYAFHCPSSPFFFWELDLCCHTWIFICYILLCFVALPFVGLVDILYTWVMDFYPICRLSNEQSVCNNNKLCNNNDHKVMLPSNENYGFLSNGVGSTLHPLIFVNNLADGI